MPLQVTHNNDFTALQRDVIDAWFAGYTTDKEQARYLGISVAALRSRLGALFYRAGVPFGARRDQAMLHIWQHGLVEVQRVATQTARTAAVLLLCFLCSGVTSWGDITPRRPGPRRNPVVRMVRSARRHEYNIYPEGNA